MCASKSVASLCVGVQWQRCLPVAPMCWNLPATCSVRRPSARRLLSAWPSASWPLRTPTPSLAGGWQGMNQQLLTMHIKKLPRNNMHVHSTERSIRFYTCVRTQWIKHAHTCMHAWAHAGALSQPLILPQGPFALCFRLAILGCQTGVSHTQHSSGVRLCVTCIPLLIICHVNHRTVVWKSRRLSRERKC